MKTKKLPISKVTRGLPQIPINVTNVTLKETKRLGDLNDPEYNRADVYFEGQMTVNGRTLPLEVHLFRVDKAGWNIGNWYVTLSVNENKNWREGVNTRDMFDALPEHCHECHKDSYVGNAFAEAIFPFLHSKGFSLAPGIGERGKPSNFWMMDVNCDAQGERIATNARARMFHYKQRRQITCPIHGEFIQETEESQF